MSEKEADPKSRCCSEFLEILKNRRGHVVKTIILGLGLNAFDVFSDVGVGSSHAQDKNVTRFFAANDTIPEYCVPVTMTRSDEDYEWLEDHTFWALSIFGPLAVLLAISAALAGVICAKMKSGKILLVALLPMLLPFLLFFLTDPPSCDTSGTPSSTQQSQCTPTSAWRRTWSGRPSPLVAFNCPQLFLRSVELLEWCC